MSRRLPLSPCMALQILVLGFCDTQRDLEVVQKILSQVNRQGTQLCLHYPVEKLVTYS